MPWGKNSRSKMCLDLLFIRKKGYDYDKWLNTIK